MAIGTNISGAQAAGLANPFPVAENLSPDEITQISAAFDQALGQAKPGTVVVWKSNESGRSGQVRVLRGWDVASGHCVELEQRFSKGDKAVYEVPYCQGQDGTWKVTF
jgi:surface antigen